MTDHNLDVEIFRLLVAKWEENDLKINLNKHFCSGKESFSIKKINPYHFVPSAKKLKKNQKAQLVNCLKEKDSKEEWHFIGWGLNKYCGECGSSIAWETNGKELRVCGPECLYPEGLVEYDIEIDVPSGKLAFDDDLREFLSVDKICDDYYYGGSIDEKRISQEYEKKGMAHGFIGNTNPYIYQNGKSIILTQAQLNDLDYEKVGRITTNLWWYSAIDYEKLCSLSSKAKDIFHISVTPGRYKFTNKPKLNTCEIKLIQKY